MTTPHLPIKDIDLDALPKFPTEPFEATALIAFFQGQLRSQRRYYHNDRALFRSIRESALDKGPQYNVSISTLNKLLYWDKRDGQNFSIQTLESVWKGLT